MFCLLEMLEVMRCVLYVLEAPEGVRCMLLCMLEAVEGVRYVLELLEVVLHLREAIGLIR